MADQDVTVAHGEHLHAERLLRELDRRTVKTIPPQDRPKTAPIATLADVWPKKRED